MKRQSNFFGFCRLFLEAHNRYQNQKYEKLVYYVYQNWRNLLIDKMHEIAEVQKEENESLCKELDNEKKKVSRVNREKEQLENELKKQKEEITKIKEMNKHYETMIEQLNQNITSI
jgi:septal ring factor EnvC (AmiA/AmiB activator)